MVQSSRESEVSISLIEKIAFSCQYSKKDLNPDPTISLVSFMEDDTKILVQAKTYKIPGFRFQYPT